MIGLEQVLNQLMLDGWLGHYRPALEPPLESGARPWSGRLRRTTFAVVAQNQWLGVRYVPLGALAARGPEAAGLKSPQEVLVELTRSGAVAALLPPPAWAVGLLLYRNPVELAWLTPVPLMRRLAS